MIRHQVLRHSHRHVLCRRRRRRQVNLRHCWHAYHQRVDKMIALGDMCPLCAVNDVQAQTLGLRLSESQQHG
ncbi:hypothetical protein [Shewanella sp. NIFS-20-20]|uniref:hypothetical protein n=1 Tax=Shewanella sp. NIFS-20-20 TaxID=2853806 RepID=UPI001C460444|nr:hypothetical protein [Shewanella sp. NIFS-20-20]MBV7316502.1 hypothetical protein [Shewanella sp. NIFS-20-20]